MTYDATDPDADGVVEADVDNQSTTTESASIGATGPVTGIVGDTGEFEPLMTVSAVTSSFSTTSTDWTPMNASADRQWVDLDTLTAITGYDEIHASMTFQGLSNANAEFRLSLQNTPISSTEYSQQSSFEVVRTPRGRIDDAASGIKTLRPECQSTDGNAVGSNNGVTVVLWGRIA